MALLNSIATIDKVEPVSGEIISSSQQSNFEDSVDSAITALSTNQQAINQQFHVYVDDYFQSGDVDDSASVQRAIDAINSSFASINGNDGSQNRYLGKLIFNSKKEYDIGTSINLTGFHGDAEPLHIDFSGTTIVGKTNGFPVFDAIGSRSISFSGEGGIIYGDTLNTPSSAIQIGRDSTLRNADEIVIFNTRAEGHYTKAALHVYASERLNVYGGKFKNESGFSGNTASYAVILDGSQTSTLTQLNTAYGSVAPIGTEASFNEVNFNGSEFNKSGGGDAVYLNRVQRARFEATYLVTFDGAGFVVDKNSLLPRNLYIDHSCRSHHRGICWSAEHSQVC